MGPAALGRENVASSVVEALQCRQNADMPITEVMVVTNDKKRQLDNSIPVMQPPLTHSYMHTQTNKHLGLDIAFSDRRQARRLFLNVQYIAAALLLSVAGAGLGRDLGIWCG